MNELFEYIAPAQFEPWGSGSQGVWGVYWLTHPQRRISHYVFTLAETQVPVWPSSGKRSRRYPCSQWSQTCRHCPPRQTCKHPDGGDAYQPVLFHFVPGAFHLDILPGRKSCAGPKTCRGTSLDVLAEPSLIRSFQIPTDWAIHPCASPAFCRANRSLDRSWFKNCLKAWVAGSGHSPMRRAGFDYAGWLGAGCHMDSARLKQPRSARKAESQTWAL
jgi:hypothetical protein